MCSSNDNSVVHREPNRQKLSRKRPYRAIAQIGVSILLLTVLLSNLDWERSLTLVGQSDLLGLLLLFGIYVFDRCLMALKWHQLLSVVTTSPTRLSTILMYYEASFVGFALPFGGLGPDIVRFVRLKAWGVSRLLGLSSMVMERAIGILASLIMTTVGLLTLSIIAPDDQLRALSLSGAAFVIVVAVVITAVLFAQRIRKAAFNALRRYKWFSDRRLIEVVEAVRLYGRNARILWWNLGLSVFEQLMPVLAYWTASYALGIPLPFFVCLVVASVASLVERLPISYAGIGAREGAATAVLMALGVGYSEAMTLVLTQFMLFVISLLPGGLVFIVHSRKDSTEPLKSHV